MTKRELNRDIQRLWARFKRYRANGLDEKEEEAIKEELRRLWYVDREAQLLTLRSMLIMLKINQALRAITLHTLATYFVIDKD